MIFRSFPDGLRWLFSQQNNTIWKTEKSDENSWGRAGIKSSLFPLLGASSFLLWAEFDIFNNQSTNIMVTMNVMPDPLSKQIRPRGSEFFLARKLWPFHPLSILAVFDESWGFVYVISLSLGSLNYFQDSNLQESWASFGVSGVSDLNIQNRSLCLIMTCLHIIQLVCLSPSQLITWV